MTTTMNGSCLGHGLAVLERRRAELFELVADVAVVLVDVAHALGGQRLVALLHLVHRPAQGVGRQLGLDDDRRQQVRDVLVHPQLEPLGVDHDQPHVVGRRAVEDAGQHRVEADRLAGARRPGDEQVRHRRQVGEVRLAVDGLAQRERELAGRLAVDVRLEQLAQRDLLADVVRHLDADGGLARQPVDDDRLGLQRQAQVVGQVGDLAVLHAGIRLELERRDDRARDGSARPSLRPRTRGTSPRAAARLPSARVRRPCARPWAHRAATAAAACSRSCGARPACARRRRSRPAAATAPRRGFATRATRWPARPRPGAARRQARARCRLRHRSAGATSLGLRLGARGARRRQRHLRGLGRGRVGALLLRVLGNHLAALRLLAALLAPRAQRSSTRATPAPAPASKAAANDRPKENCVVRITASTSRVTITMTEPGRLR